jgi:hypothetical protein
MNRRTPGDSQVTWELIASMNVLCLAKVYVVITCLILSWAGADHASAKVNQSSLMFPALALRKRY